MSERPVLLLETQIFPSFMFFGLAFNHTIVLEAMENYQKRSCRNRYFIKGRNNESICLSIPLQKGKNQNQPIQEVRISHDREWTKQHQKTLQSIYGKSPFFKYYIDELSELYSSDENYLFDLNLNIIHWLLKQFQLRNSIRQSTEYLKEIPGDIIDLRRQSWSQIVKQYSLSIPMSYELRSPSVFPELCSLDLLFHFGPEAGFILEEICPAL